MIRKPVTIFWLRRDLRLHDNTGLYYALAGKYPVLPLFIFDTHILEHLEEKRDARVQFIHERLMDLQKMLQEKGSSLLVEHGAPEAIFSSLLQKFDVREVYTNRDYEPYALERDQKIEELLSASEVPFYTFKDQVIFEKDEVAKGDGHFYKVFTPYKKVWMEKFRELALDDFGEGMASENWYKEANLTIPPLNALGFQPSDIPVPSSTINEKIIRDYHKTRNYPAQNGTSRLGIHLRHGTISIRRLVKKAASWNNTYLNELIWREFYMQILYHNPEVVTQSFKPQYDKIPWHNDPEVFDKWCRGVTGYPIVDAGMRQLNQTGYMHNRLRMITASFLTKHLLIDWRWGEAYFAQKLLDYELSSNNGGWQWAAGTGTDAQPYFRIFNPMTQTEKFDPDRKFIKQWVPEVDTPDYPEPMVDHKMARERALDVFKKALEKE